MPFATTNPATGQIEKTFDTHTPAEVEALIQRAVVAFGEYRHTTFAERARHLITAAELLEGEVPDVARILTTEMGKTFASARGEVSKCALGLRWFAEHAEALLADEPIATGASRSYVHYQPIGPVLAIMPWNFPMWQVVRFAAPALMVGNVGLLKHASNVPQTALLLEDLFRRAGLPEGVFTNLFVESKDIAKVIEDPRIAAVTLTGSERAGMSVASTAGHALKKSVLELGGSDAFIVLESADMETTVRTAVEARVQNNGQSCIAAKRFIVVEPVADEFLRRFTEAMDALVVGDPFDPATDVGPIVTQAQRAELVAQVEEARTQGATVHSGGQVVDGPGWYFPPTVLSGITADMRVAQEELFGPVAMVERVPDLTAALEVANATTFGLGSSVWGTDEAEIQRCIEELEAGAVFVNAMVASTPELPFGGIKRSGFGRELSELGLKEFCNAKTVWIT
jgi:succinate-semialdehyde dehydrogenase/glutarate-semialdehyde dehydrogenase